MSHSPRGRRKSTVARDLVLETGVWVPKLQTTRLACVDRHCIRRPGIIRQLQVATRASEASHPLLRISRNDIGEGVSGGFCGFIDLNVISCTAGLGRVALARGRTLAGRQSRAERGIVITTLTSYMGGCLDHVRVTSILQTHDYRWKHHRICSRARYNR